MINFETVEKLCAMLCTEEEIASFLGVSIDTLASRIKEEYGLTFPEYYKKHSGAGRMSLRRKQFEVAMAGNVSMLIWLGKNILNQSDKQEMDVTSNGETLPVALNVHFTDS